MGRKRRSSHRAQGILFLIVPTLIVLGIWLVRSGNFTWPVATASPAVREDDVCGSNQMPAGDPPGLAASPASIRIATWNIRHLGSRRGIDYRAISGIITRNAFDLVAIQEVLRDGAGVDALLNTLGPPWRSTHLSPESPGGERLTFIYRDDRIRPVSPAVPLGGASTGVFERLPYAATFRCGAFDFELITVHLSWGDVAQRSNEMRTLADLVARRLVASTEKDIILLGDFNEQKSRPNLSYLHAAGFQTDVRIGTNLSSREMYDHILIHPNHTREYLGQTAVFAFDELLYGNDDKQAVTAVSDHRPVYADFATTGPDDD